MHALKFIFISIILSMTISCPAQTTSTDYKILNTYSLPGDGGWDYLALDQPTGRLFIAHASVTQVVDKTNGQLLAQIPNTPGVHGIAFDQEHQKAFISCGRDTSVMIVHLKTLQLIERVHVTGANPDAIVYDKWSKKVFVFNHSGQNATVLDAKTNQIVATIKLEGQPEFAVTDNKGKLYVNIEDKSMLSCIDANSMKVIKSWSLAPGKGPTGLAADFANSRLFSACSNQGMVVFDLKNEKVQGIIPIGKYSDGAAYDEKLQRAYSSNGEGSLTVIDCSEGKYRILETVQTQLAARTICLDPETHHLFLTTASFEPVMPGQKRAKITPGSFVLMEVAPL